MQIFLLIMVGLLACVNVYQQKQIKLLEDRTLISLKLICKKLRKDSERKSNASKR